MSVTRCTLTGRATDISPRPEREKPEREQRQYLCRNVLDLVLISALILQGVQVTHWGAVRYEKVPNDQDEPRSHSVIVCGSSAIETFPPKFQSFVTLLGNAVQYQLVRFARELHSALADTFLA